MSKRTGGAKKCAVKTCHNTSCSGLSLFSFPRDYIRCRNWAVACDRLDMFERLGTEKMSKGHYRVCSAHFSEYMFLNDLKNRLQPHAIPVLRLQEEETTAFIKPDPDLDIEEQIPYVECFKFEEASTSNTPEEYNYYTDATNPSTEELISYVEYIKSEPSTSTTQREHDYCTQPSENFIEVDPLQITNPSTIEPPKTAIKSVQTTAQLSAHSPRKEKLRAKVKELQRKLRKFQKKPKEEDSEEEEEEEDDDDVTIDYFKKLCDKFLPPEEATVAKTQAEIWEKAKRNAL